MKKKITVIFLLLAVTLLSLPAAAIDLEAGTGEDFYLQDTANVLSAETKSQIVQYNETLESQCGEAQLVVVTLNYLDEDSDVAALQLMNDWGVGSAEDSNGMLLLLVAQEHRGWLATGDGIDHVFTDDTCDKYLNEYFWDYVDNDEFDEGVQCLTAALYDWYLEYYEVSGTGSSALSQTEDTYVSEYEPYPQPYESQRGNNFMNILTLIIVIVVLWALIANSRYHRMRGWGYGGSFWPVFWFGGHRMYRDWYRRNPGPRPPHTPHRRGGPGGPGMGPGGPGGMSGRGGMGGHPSGHRSTGGPRPGGMGGRPSSGSRGGGMGGGPRGGGMGGHGGGGGGGRR